MCVGFTFSRLVWTRIQIALVARSNHEWPCLKTCTNPMTRTPQFPHTLSLWKCFINLRTTVLMQKCYNLSCTAGGWSGSVVLSTHWSMGWLSAMWCSRLSSRFSGSSTILARRLVVPARLYLDVREWQWKICTMIFQLCTWRNPQKSHFFTSGSSRHEYDIDVALHACLVATLSSMCRTFKRKLRPLLWHRAFFCNRLWIIGHWIWPQCFATFHKFSRTCIFFLWLYFSARLSMYPYCRKFDF